MREAFELLDAVSAMVKVYINIQATHTPIHASQRTSRSSSPPIPDSRVARSARSRTRHYFWRFLRTAYKWQRIVILQDYSQTSCYLGCMSRTFLTLPSLKLKKIDRYLNNRYTLASLSMVYCALYVRTFLTNRDKSDTLLWLPSNAPWGDWFFLEPQTQLSLYSVFRQPLPSLGLECRRLFCVLRKLVTRCESHISMARLLDTMEVLNRSCNRSKEPFA